MFRLVLLGPPAAGKGTLAGKLSRKYNIPHISTGELFRNKIKEGTSLGTKAKEYMDRGELVPDQLVIDMVEERLAAEDCQKGFLLDGYPRTVYQAEQLDKYLTEHGVRIDKTIDMSVDQDETLARMQGRRVCKSCGAIYHVTNMPPKQEGICDVCGGPLYQRMDDNEETVKVRFRIYREETNPLVDYYAKTGTLVQIDGNGEWQRAYTAALAILGA